MRLRKKKEVQQTVYPSALEGILTAERPRLVRLCAYLTGSSEAAEDLAQEILCEAWRHRAQLQDTQGGARWLNAIARNVCLRWRQRQGQHAAQVPLPEDETLHALVDDAPALEEELERAELAALLDRALGLLPSPTRQMLLHHYLQASPYAAIARELGMSEGAVKVQVHRGKLTLRRLLSNELREDALSYGLAVSQAEVWQFTRIWCPLCGQRRLEGMLDAAQGGFALRCPACVAETGVYTNYLWPELFQGVTSLKPAFHRVMRWAYPYYQQALAEQHAPCVACGRIAPLCRQLPDDDFQARQDVRGMYVYCDACQGGYRMRLSNWLLYHPEAWRFWQEHPRLQLLPERASEVTGRPALLVRYQSLVDLAGLEMLVAQNTYEVLAIQQSGGPYRVRERQRSEVLQSEE
jgi:RNA polymerase sigma factor (sigma-70 family)